MLNFNVGMYALIPDVLLQFVYASRATWGKSGLGQASVAHIGDGTIRGGRGASPDVS